MNTTTKILAVCSLAFSVAAPRLAVTAEAKGNEIPMTLTGCVVAGEGKDSFLLTGVTIDGDVPRNAFYRLDSTKDLRTQVGHRVEVSGKADLGDYEKGKVKVSTDDGKTTMKVSAGGDSVKVNAADVWAGSAGSMKMKGDIATYQLEVKHVTRIDGACNP
jgi:hypothetical protein